MQPFPWAACVPVSPGPPQGCSEHTHQGQISGAGAVQQGWGSTGEEEEEEAGAHLVLEVHVGHVAADGSVSLVLAPALLGVLEAALTQGTLVAGAPHLTHVDGPQA